jgi:type IV pilus assembly protein PilB
MAPRKRLGELLVQAGVIDELQLKSALGEQRKWGRPLGQTLVELGFVEENTLMSLLSTQLNIPAIALDQVTPSAQAIQHLDYDFCIANLCFPFNYEEKGPFLDVAMAEPTNPALFDRIRVLTRCNVRPHLAGHRAVEKAIRKAYRGETFAPKPENRPWMSRPDEVVFDLDGGGVDSSKVDPAVMDPATMEPGPADMRHRPRQTEEQPALGHAPGVDPEAFAELEQMVQQLWAHLERDEKVIRKLMALLVERGICTREELIARINED